MKTVGKKILMGLMGLALVAGLSVVADAATAGKPKAPKNIHRTVVLTAGKADTIDLKRPVADVLVANPAVADVGSLRANRLYIVGKAVGDTNVLAFDDEGNQLADITVRVRVDETSLRDTMREFFPDEDIDIRTVKNEVILSGAVSTPGVANKVRDLASRFVTQGGGAARTIVDLMRVKGEQQVMLKVRVLEVNRSLLREYGVRTTLNEDIGSPAAGVVGGLYTAADTGLTQVPFGVGGILMSQQGDFGPAAVNLRGLERDGLVNTLAEPNLTAISGETAGFLAGGEYPIPIARDRDGNITLEFKKFGVSLNFTPTVMSEDQISLQLATEVSELTDENSFDAGGTTIRGLNVRRADTTIQIGSGGTLMMAGLIKSGSIQAMNGLPGVQDIPIIGDLFKSKSFTRNESELLILVTPYIVKPFADKQASLETPLAKNPAYMLPGAGGSVTPGTLPPVFDDAIVPPVENTPPLPVQKSQMMQPVYQNKPPVDTAAAMPSPLPVPKPVPVETAMLAPLEKLPEVRPPVEKQGQPVLSQAFMQNLHNVYGGKTPPRPASGGAFGYMVD
jgi:pilus assembly protein CpaC